MLVYFLQRERGKKNLICMTGAVWSQPDMSMDSIAPSIYFFAYYFFSQCNLFFRAQKKDAKRFFFFGSFVSASGLHCCLLKTAIKITQKHCANTNGSVMHRMISIIFFYLQETKEDENEHRMRKDPSKLHHLSSGLPLFF